MSFKKHLYCMSFRPVMLPITFYYSRQLWLQSVGWYERGLGWAGPGGGASFWLSSDGDETDQTFCWPLLIDRPLCVWQNVPPSWLSFLWQDLDVLFAAGSASSSSSSPCIPEVNKRKTQVAGRGITHASCGSISAVHGCLFLKKTDRQTDIPAA